jgi:hypothetical protein
MFRCGVDIFEAYLRSGSSPTRGARSCNASTSARPHGPPYHSVIGDAMTMIMIIIPAAIGPPLGYFLGPNFIPPKP